MGVVGAGRGVGRKVSLEGVVVGCFEERYVHVEIVVSLLTRLKSLLQHEQSAIVQSYILKQTSQ